MDEVSKTANCLACGPVNLARKSGRWKCWKAKQEQRGNVGAHGLTMIQAAKYRSGKSCEICGHAVRLVVDHCHESGVIRGVLCHWCNIAIGMMRDDPDRLRRAATYLER